MSSNDYLFIGHTKKGYRVVSRDADTGHKLLVDKYFKTLEEACRYAETIQNEYEYGVYFSLLDLD